MRSMAGMSGMSGMSGMPARMAANPMRALMDVGIVSPHALNLLAVYDTSGVIPGSIVPGTVTVPASAKKAVIRVSGPSGGGQGTDTGFGTNPRTFHNPGASAGAFAKVTLNNINAGDTFATISTYNGVSGLGISRNGIPVCFAMGGTFSPQDSFHAGGSADQSLGDLCRSGGYGQFSGGGQGGAGDHGELGSNGGLTQSGPNPPFSTQVTITAFGGTGGQGGDFGDPDGVGYGWDITTGLQYSASTFPISQRWTVHFYGF